MAVINFSKKDFLSLVGKELSDQELDDAVSMIGAPLDSMEGDEVAVEITPDRPDLLCVEGIARAVRAFAGVEEGLKTYEAADSGMELKVDKSVKDVRPFIAAAAVKNVELTDELVASLMQLQEKLHDTLGRKRKKVSIGVYDLDTVQAPFVYKAVKPESVEFVPLEMNERMNMHQILEKHPKGIAFAEIVKEYENYPVLMDKYGKVLSFPPIINSEDTRVTPETKNLFIDCTGSSYYAVMDSLQIICAALADRGARIETILVRDGRKKIVSPDLSPIKTKASANKINKLLGLDLSAGEMAGLLGKLGHTAKAKKKSLTVYSPFYRNDLLHWVDVAEDVAIAYGYNNIETTLPGFASIGKPDPTQTRDDKIRQVMIGMGYCETLNWYITNEEKNYSWMLTEGDDAVKMKNPLTSTLTMMRTWITPSLLEVFSINKSEKMPQKIFEVGDVATMKGEEAVEERKLAGAIIDAKASFNDMKSVVETVMFEMDWEHELKELKNHPSFIPGRAAEIICKGKAIGFFGEIHPQVLNNFGLEQPTAVFELYLE